jgi:hypothetical protein
MHTISPKFLTKEQTSFTELLDNVEGIILDLDNLHYYTLNSTGLFIWKQLRSGLSQTREQLAEALSQSFSQSPDAVASDLMIFLEELEGNGLIHKSEVEGLVNGSVTVSGTLPSYEAPRLKLSNSLTQVTLSGSSTIATAAIATG